MYLEEKIENEGRSLGAAMGELKHLAQAYRATICTKTAHNYIDIGLFAGFANENLPMKRTKNRHRRRRIIKAALNNIRGRSNEGRDAAVKERADAVSWEKDCVVGKAGTVVCLLVMTERKYALELIFKTLNKA